MTRHLLAIAARRTFGPLVTVRVVRGAVFVCDADGGLVIGYPDVEAARAHMRGLPRWDDRPWWRRAGEWLGGAVLAVEMVRLVRVFERLK